MFAAIFPIHATFFFYPEMPAWVTIPDRIILGISIPIPTLRIGRAGHDGIWLDEPPNGGIIVPCDIVHYRKHGNASLASKREVGLSNCANFSAHFAKGQVALFAY
jgi:hypothetical protein